MSDGRKAEVKIALDVMGGDYAPSAIVDGALRAVNREKRIHVIFAGRRDDMERALAGRTYPESQVSMQEASQVIEMAEAPVAAVRGKKDSSLVVGMRMVRAGEADAFVSAGNTGAVLVGAQTIVGRLPGIERPALGAVIPTRNGACMLLDCGANVDARASHLLQFARLGSIYMKHMMGVKEPSVGLLNIGAEEGKGNALVKETYPLLKACDDIRFTGSVEAGDIPGGAADVVVCDGFAGNIALKMYEGAGSVLIGTVKGAMAASLSAKAGAWLAGKALKKALRKYEPSVYGGAPMLGCRSLVVKMHGRAKAAEVCQTMFQCLRFVDTDLTRIMGKEIQHGI